MAIFAQLKALEARVAALEKQLADLLAAKTLKLPEKNARLSA